MATFEPTEVTIATLRAHVRWMAQTVHQAYHDDPDTWDGSCPKDICASTRRFLADLDEPTPVYPRPAPDLLDTGRLFDSRECGDPEC